MGTLTLAKAQWGSELADVGGHDMQALDSAVATVLWGHTCTSCNRERLWAVLAPPHRMALPWQVQYRQISWLAWIVATPSTAQVLLQAALEERSKPLLTATVRQALRATMKLSQVALGGWWCLHCRGRPPNCTWSWGAIRSKSASSFARFRP